MLPLFIIILIIISTIFLYKFYKTYKSFNQLNDYEYQEQLHHFLIFYQLNFFKINYWIDFNTLYNWYYFRKLNTPIEMSLFESEYKYILHKILPILSFNFNFQVIEHKKIILTSKNKYKFKYIFYIIDEYNDEGWCYYINNKKLNPLHYRWTGYDQKNITTGNFNYNINLPHSIQEVIENHPPQEYD